MHKPDFWTSHGEALEMALEGNRVISHELAEMAGRLWKKATHAFEGLLQGHGQHQHLPPK